VQAANNAINCADFASRPTVATVHEHEAEFALASPVFGRHLVWSLLACADWPVTGERDQPQVRIPPQELNDVRPILLLATTGDPATPYVGAERMKRALGGDVGVLITYDGEGHGAYGSGDACVVEAVNRYLLLGEIPADGMACP
jgi:hypothetical protein